MTLNENIITKKIQFFFFNCRRNSSFRDENHNKNRIQFFLIKTKTKIAIATKKNNRDRERKRDDYRDKFAKNIKKS